ncbi:MAG: cytochrome P450 [Kocuria sp.]|nr:cytochrome P450 [Kocuria sp.]
MSSHTTVWGMSVCPYSDAAPGLTVSDPELRESQRKALPDGEESSPAVEEKDGLWHIRSLPLVRQVLRTSEHVTQSGFAVETSLHAVTMKRWPVLYTDGAEHREQRAKIARFFAPVVVNRNYRDLVIDRAEAYLAQYDDAQPHDLAETTLLYSTQVAAKVIGLTGSDPRALATRLARFFNQRETMMGDRPRGLGLLKTLPGTARSLSRLGWFFLRDVRPAIRYRKAALKKAEQGGPAAPDDVITYLINEGYNGLEITMECLTYGAAGMVTTREFLQMATWHLVENMELRQRFLVGGSDERQQILHEILRLEPVVGQLYRKAQRELRLVDHSGAEYVIPAGARMRLYVRQANTDADQVGEDALQLCPGRELPPGIRREVMSFGDGAHRCPGNSIAMLESEVFLERLFRREVTVVGQPQIQWEHVVSGYAVRNLLLTAPQRRG